MRTYANMYIYMYTCIYIYIYVYTPNHPKSSTRFH